MGRTILIIEDSPTELAIVSDSLRAAGYTIQQAASGNEAKECLEQGPIDAIVLDLILPDMNGYDLYRYFQQDERSSKVPIVILTSRTSMPEEYYGRMLGAAAYLKKPFQPLLLLSELQRLVPLT
jgi:DNA-binding response OmpR family regulator